MVPGYQKSLLLTEFAEFSSILSYDTLDQALSVQVTKGRYEFPDEMVGWIFWEVQYIQGAKEN